MDLQNPRATDRRDAFLAAVAILVIAKFAHFVATAPMTAVTAPRVDMAQSTDVMSRDVAGTDEFRP